MEATLLLARLNSAGTHLVCGMKDCGTRLAVVNRFTTAEDMENAGQAGDPAGGIIQFLPGWARRRKRMGF